MSKSILYSLVLLGLVLACGSDGKKSGTDGEDFHILDTYNGKPLTGTQKVAFTDLVNSLQSIDKAQRAADSGQGTGQTKTEDMKKALREAGCAIEIRNPGRSTGGSYDYTYLFNVSGDACPVQQEAATHSISKPGDVVSRTDHVHYLVRDNAYVALNDVTELSYDYQMKLGFSFPTGASKVDGRGQGAGFLKSQKQGEVKITTESAASIIREASGVNGGIEVLTQIQITDFVVYLRSKLIYSAADPQGKAFYYLNGAEVAAEVYNSYMKVLTVTDADAL